MIHSICVIDDAIPTEQEKLVDIDTNKELDSNTLRYLLREEINWTTEEESLKNLIEKLIEDKEHWDVSAFKHPNYYINSIDNNLTRPEIIIFDWEFHTETTFQDSDKVNVLYRILDESFSIVCIYSGADEIDEINEVIDSASFKSYRHRIKLIDKNTMESGKMPHEMLFNEVNKVREDNFSFKFGKIIKQNSLIAADKILVELGNATLGDIKNYFKINPHSKMELIDFIGMRLKSRLNTIDVGELLEKEPRKTEGNNTELRKRIWSWRLYFDPGPSEKLVRKGDVVYDVTQPKDTIYLVISGDCDLEKFWHKNFGFINLVPLTEFSKNNDVLIEKLKLTRHMDTTKFKKDLYQKSFSNRIECLCEGPFFLPFLDINGTLKFYIGFPKEMITQKITLPERCEKPEEERLLYAYWNQYQRLCRLSEPFMSPLIENIIKSLSGYGTPDYDKHMQDIFKNELGLALT